MKSFLDIALVSSPRTYLPGCDRRAFGVFVGKLVAASTGAEIVDLGIIVSLGKALFVEVRLAHPQSRAKKSTEYKSDRICLSAARKIFIELVSYY